MCSAGTDARSSGNGATARGRGGGGAAEGRRRLEQGGGGRLERGGGRGFWQGFAARRFDRGGAAEETTISAKCGDRGSLYTKRPLVPVASNNRYKRPPFNTGWSLQPVLKGFFRPLKFPRAKQPFCTGCSLQPVLKLFFLEFLFSLFFFLISLFY